MSDKRITDGINGVARVAVLYYCVMRDSAILFYSYSNSLCIDKFYTLKEWNVKSYIYMSFLFLILSYMTPKEQYKKYFQFMLGIFMAVVILKPLGKDHRLDLNFDQVYEKIEDISYENKTNMFEAFVTEEK